MSIPASEIVQVNPGVIGAGGSALDLNGLALTNNGQVPVGFVQSFANTTDVSNFFGPTSPEASAANIYFLGFNNSTKKPGLMFFAQYPAANVAAYLRGGSLSGMTLDQLKALSGTIIVTMDGAVKTSSAISLTAATSFSNAATIIAAAFTAGPAVTYNAQLNAFTFTSTTTGATSTMSVATGTLSAGLKLTQALGAVTSQGAVAGVPAANMAAITAITQNWAAFTTIFEPDAAGKLAFSAWTNSQNNRYVYAGWDTDVQAATQGSTTSWGALLAAGNYSGSAPIYQSVDDAVFVLGTIASIDFERTNGRITLAFKGQTGLTPTVTDATTANTLIANGYNFYGDYATANDKFQFFYPGQISGPFKWIDPYINQIWMNNGFQQALMTLLTTVNSIPYNVAGDTLIEAACMDPINAALNFGAIRTGVVLSSLQAAEVNNQAGVDIASTLQTRGWYLQIQEATAQVRAARGTPPMTFWYMDGGAVQQLVLASIEIQ
jgi:hypothetical protein